ncbi:MULTISPECIES: response regulator transcription factor [Paenibacillus]|uniref:Response regulator transcription factor n=1 Tax=Paenibacillus radicis (ex Xue et al. 2023) TaxID=2972489 RepID=A0ABT1YJI4_9BACL|nr:response regulator transcription factor [Paenibacillus radicis (ex Xue et al. 2023)]MCR8633353.1 response regulator transcription factor [Paenibacillus radicis (ex Xue et al. 2023)]
MAGQTILVVEDDPEIRDVIRLYLEKHKFTVALADRGDEALQLVRTVQPDLIILDVLLPGKDGFEVCKEIRQETSVPVLFLSCKKEEQDKITGLTLGGDDYITKPFSPNELIARVQANLRRPYFSNNPTSHPTKLEFGALYIDLLSRTVKVNEIEIVLSKKEFDLLKFLAGRPGQTFSHEELFREIWGQESFNDTRTIIVHVSNLRKKIEPDPSNPQYIINVHGVGYKFILS